MKKQHYLLLGTIVLALAFFSCKKKAENPVSATKTILVEVQNLEPLKGNYVYEGWLVQKNSGGNPTFTSVGQLSVDDNTEKADIFTLTANANVLDAATAFAITLESTTDGDPTPSQAFILGGSFGNDSDKNTAKAVLTANDDSGAINMINLSGTILEFELSSGSFILKTPSDNDTTNELSGIWWLNPNASAGQSQATLQLPLLDKNHWQYEGWVVIPGKDPISTGKFQLGDTGLLADLSETYNAKDNPTPNYPGEDFLTNAPSGFEFPTDLSGTKVVISVEPYPDNDPSPFFIKPLIANIPAGAMAGTPYNMTQNVVKIVGGKAEYLVPIGLATKK